MVHTPAVLLALLVLQQQQQQVQQRVQVQHARCVVRASRPPVAWSTTSTASPTGMTCTTR